MADLVIVQQLQGIPGAGGTGVTPTGTGFPVVIGGVLQTAAIGLSLSGDTNTATASTNGTLVNTTTSMSGGTAATASTVPANLQFTPMVPNAGAATVSTGTPGGSNITVAAPLSGGAEAGFTFTRVSAQLFKGQALLGALGKMGFYGPVTPSSTNYGIAIGPSTTVINGTLGCGLAYGSSLTWSVVAPGVAACYWAVSNPVSLLGGTADIWPDSATGAWWAWDALNGKYPLFGGGVSSGVYGDGSDGAMVLDGTNTFTFASLSTGVYTLSRDINPTTVEVKTGIGLATAGFAIRASTSITVDSGGLMANPGNSGSSGSAGAAAGSLGGGFAGGAGGSSTNGTVGTGGSSNQFPVEVGGTQWLGGVGGGGGLATGGSYGPWSPVTAGNSGSFRALPGAALGGGFGAAGFVPFWAGSGGGGGGSTAATGGAGGGGAGVMLLASPIIINNGSIQANGGAGQAGSGATAAGGGGGGAGGLIYLITRSFTGTTPTVPGGAGGAAVHSGVAGTAGGAGLVIQLSA